MAKQDQSGWKKIGREILELSGNSEQEGYAIAHQLNGTKLGDEELNFGFTMHLGEGYDKASLAQTIEDKNEHKRDEVRLLAI